MYMRLRVFASKAHGYWLMYPVCVHGYRTPFDMIVPLHIERFLPTRQHRHTPCLLLILHLFIETRALWSQNYGRDSASRSQSNMQCSKGRKQCNVWWLDERTSSSMYHMRHPPNSSAQRWNSTPEGGIIRLDFASIRVCVDLWSRGNLTGQQKLRY